jgi:Na+-driven multidrug efflux pump
MSAPLVVSFWMRSAFTFVDTAYAATLGDSAVAAIGLTAPFEFLMIAVWVGLSTGLTSGLSRAMGARQGARIEQYLGLTWKLVVATSIAFVALGAGIWALAPRFGLEPDVERDFRIYGAVLIAGSAFTSFWSVIPDSLVKAHHDTRATMWAGIWSNVINVVLNTLFLFVFHWGVFGIALSTVIGRLGGLVYALVQAGRHERRRKAADLDTRPERDPRPARALLALAVPSSMTFALMGAEVGLVNALLATLRNPTEGIAAYSIFYRVQMFALTPIIAIGVAMLPYAARRFGAGDVAGVRRGLRDAGLASAAYAALLVGPVMVAGARALADALSESELTAAYAAFALRLVPISVVVGTPFLLCRPIFEGLGRGVPGLAVAAIRYVVLTAPLAWIGMRIAERMGEPALYGLLVGTLTAAAVASAVFYGWVAATLRALEPVGMAGEREAARA